MVIINQRRVVNRNGLSTLFDLFGKPVACEILEMGKNEITIDTRNLAPGLYCYALSNVNGSPLKAYATTDDTSTVTRGKVLISR